ncbi:SEL1 [Musa troglodytarum]|uniref:SEL1 n=1 Tax=Musa troglodytarum TaxID=320322 RepID=A0A9E7HXL9_9LILI|nr:SEL1 [Musa troglodytarum]
MDDQRKRTAVSSFVRGRSRRRRWSPPSPRPALPTAAASFADLPFDVLARLAAPFDMPTLWAASTVCQSWREALRPLREAMVLLRLGKGYKRGRGPGIGRPNPHRALEYFLKGVDRGSAPAMVDAGLMYWEMGKKEEAEALYRRAAELGYPAGQCNLGVCYLEADQPKSEEAVKWFYRAAESGYASAQYNLALCLHKGCGVKNDLANAVCFLLTLCPLDLSSCLHNGLWTRYMPFSVSNIFCDIHPYKYVIYIGNGSVFCSCCFVTFRHDNLVQLLLLKRAEFFFFKLLLFVG